MTKLCKFTLSSLALFQCAFFSASAAAAAPKVVFIGDAITYNWSNIATTANWVNKGVDDLSINGPGGSYGVLARFQSDVVSLHPSIVHIMIGAADAQIIYDSDYTFYTEWFADNLDAIVKEAKAANIKVILGMGAQNFEFAGNVEPINAVIAAYGAAHNIPVINYGDVLCGCVGSITPGGIGLTPAANYPDPPSTPLLVSDGIDGDPYTPSAAGYSLMTEMAQNAITAVSYSLKSGYLQNTCCGNNANEGGPAVNVNSVGSNAVVQFTPQGVYTNGAKYQLLNSAFSGSSGTWTSSNPLVMYVNQKGTAWGLTGGTATISYTSPTGVHFSPWIMHVAANGF